MSAPLPNSDAETPVASFPASIPTIPVTPRRAPRGRNFTQEEDKQLCRSWLAISQDPATGADQRSSSFWARVHDNYEAMKIWETERSTEALQSRWAVVQKAVNKFCGCMAQIEARERSGINIINKIQDAKRLYAETVNKAFLLDHCFDILREAPKWRDFMTARSAPRTRCPSSTPSIGIAVSTLGNAKSPSADTTSGEPGAVSGLEDGDRRPPGRKASKKGKNVNMDGMMAALNSIAARQDEANKVNAENAVVNKRKVEVLNYMHEDNLFTKSLDGMDEEQKEYFSLKRRKVLERLRAEE